MASLAHIMQIVFIGLGVFCLSTSTPAFAQQAGSIKWQQRPSPERFMPLSAVLGIPSVAVVRCESTDDNPRLSCTAVDESPLGLGVGQAGVKALESGVLAADQPRPMTLQTRVLFDVDISVARTEWTGYRPSQREIDAQRVRVSRLPQMPGFIFDMPPTLTATGAEHRERLLRIQEQIEIEFRPRLSEIWSLIAARTREKVWSEREASMPTTFWLGIWSNYHPEAADFQNQVNDRVREIFCGEVECSPEVTNSSSTPG